MNTIITRSAADFGALISSTGVQPDFVHTRPVRCAGSFTSDTFALGTRFHALLRRIRDHGPLDHHEKLLLPFLDTLRGELRGHGVSYFEPEVVLPACDGLPNSRCDLLLTGGLAPVGVCEVKVTHALPDRPAHAHLMQLAIYEELVALTRGEEQLWGCVTYVSFVEKRIRVFGMRDVARIRNAARQLLAA